jgi:polyphosphate kinase 2
MAKNKKTKDHSAKAKIKPKSITSDVETSLAVEQNDQLPMEFPKLSKKTYEKELTKLEIELVKLQEWVKQQGLKVVVIFEGRDAAGKGGAIKSITQCLNPRLCRVVALGKPSDYERTQWYFQRYTAELPAAGEIVLFDRSWYNRAGVEHVMGYCTHEEYVEFLRSCPEFEDMIQRSGIILIKYWFSVSDNEQEARFRDRIKDPRKRWKFSPMDLEARARWVEYSKAKDDMFNATDTQLSPWYTINADDKRRARLNCINHLLAKIPYEDVLPAAIELPPIQNNMVYVRPPMSLQNFIPDVTGNLR